MSKTAEEFAVDAKRVYKEMREKHGRLAADLDALNQKLDEVSKSRDLTFTAKLQRQTELRGQVYKAQTALDAVQVEARQKFGGIRKAAREAFPAYRIDKGAIDRDALELIDSGVMSASELVEFVNREDYANKNYTMSRLVAGRLQKLADEMSERPHDESERQRIQALAFQLGDVQSPIEKALGKFGTVAEMALRGDALLADGIAESMMPEISAQLDADCHAIDSGE